MRWRCYGGHFVLSNLVSETQGMLPDIRVFDEILHSIVNHPFPLKIQNRVDTENFNRDDRRNKRENTHKKKQHT